MGSKDPLMVLERFRYGFSFAAKSFDYDPVLYNRDVKDYPPVPS